MAPKVKKEKAKMSFFTALSLSFKNLLDGLGADVQGALAKGEALVAQTGDGGLDYNLVWIKDGSQEVGAHIGHHDAHLLEHVIANDVQEVFCLAHVEQREIDRIVDMAE